jgi:NHS family xanthosine MFS transporter
MAIFLFCHVTWAALQITNMFGDTFIRDFGSNPIRDFWVEHFVLIISLSQISETLFILTILFLKTIWYQTSMIFLV